MTVTPMLVSPARVLPDGPDWAYELKWDGARALLDIGDRTARVVSRHGTDLSGAFPELAPIAAALDARRAVLDGELVVMGEDGRPHFEQLSTRITSGTRHAAYRARTTPATFIAFDLLSIDGQDLCEKPWTARRALLDRLALNERSGPWRVNPAYDDGAALLQATRNLGLEGVVAKRRDSTYVPGRRSRRWVKTKNQTSGWFDLVGWQPPQGKRPGGLLVADDGDLVGVAFPALPADQRSRLRLILDQAEMSPAGRFRIRPGVAQVRVDYLERRANGSLREPIARAVRDADHPPQ